MISILSENNVAFRIDSDLNLIGDIEQNNKPIANMQISTQIENILYRIDQMEKDTTSSKHHFKQFNLIV